MKFTVKYISATCVEYSFGNEIDLVTNETVLHIYKLLPQVLDMELEGIFDIVPAYTSLTLYFKSSCKLLSDIHVYDTLIVQILQMPYTKKIVQHIIDVEYNGEDIDYVCEKLDLTKDEIINLHCSSYPIAMIGFRDFFPYLLGLDEKLRIPRRENPRTKVKQGAVAIAAGQTGIYPEESPGGWHIIGYTDFSDYHLLKPADIITFKQKEKKC